MLSSVRDRLTASLGAGGFLPCQHTPGAFAAPAFILAPSALDLYRPARTQVVPDGLLVVGLVPWTCLLKLIEADLVAPATAATNQDRAQIKSSQAGLPLIDWLLIELAAFMISMVRGFKVGNGIFVGWYNGYHRPTNVVCIGKNYFREPKLLLLNQSLQDALVQQAGRKLPECLSIRVGRGAPAALLQRLASSLTRLLAQIVKLSVIRRYIPFLTPSAAAGSTA